MISKRNATLIGLMAVLLWSSIVGLIRGVSESLGATGGAAMIYSVASVFLLLSVGFPKLREFPRTYLFWGSLLFVSYELCLALSIGYANSSQQAIEVSMVNYLWPALTMVCAIVFNHQKTNFLIIPGFIIALMGICWVLGGERGLDFASITANIQDNPLSYALAFMGALIWAAYCTVTARIANGKNG
ncbi:aromatic amino acid DMT transporter YddG, partial [Acinetobacter courvalinii]|uniref:aromatic amino acid DMT transporter YddG n=2 Tax=Acinetobacter TaxID=469 RepID=UPI00289CB354